MIPDITIKISFPSQPAGDPDGTVAATTGATVEIAPPELTEEPAGVQIAPPSVPEDAQAAFIPDVPATPGGEDLPPPPTE